MCGIAGTFQQSEGKILASTMIERIAHRGPDACALHEMVRPRYSVTLAHARLSIIDLTTAANQPFAKDSLTLAYNGELYNYRELRNELDRSGRLVRDPLRHRGRARGLAALGHVGPGPFPRHVRLRHSRRRVR